VEEINAVKKFSAIRHRHRQSIDATMPLAYPSYYQIFCKNCARVDKQLEFASLKIIVGTNFASYRAGLKNPANNVTKILLLIGCADNDGRNAAGSKRNTRK
jgi:hypothetical protein